MNSYNASEAYNLLYELSKKEYRVRYKQAILGFTWAVIRPLLLVAAFYLVFGKVADLDADENLNYFTMVYLGMMPWFLFINIMTDGGNSMLANTAMVTKVYFPRILLPLSVIFVSMVDFILLILILIVFGVYFEILYSFQFLWIPVVTILTMLPAISLALILSPLSALYRDIKFIIPFLAQIGVYLTPVGFSSELIKDKIGLMYYLNPMVLPIEAFRGIFSGVFLFDTRGVIITLVVNAVLLLTALKIFYQFQSKVVDRI